MRMRTSNIRRIRSRAGRITAMGVAAGLGIAMVGVAAPVASATGATVPVPQGIDPAHYHGAQAFGTTAADQPMTVSFILKARDVTQLEQQVDSGYYQQGTYLTTSQFAAQYGALPATVRELQQLLASHHIVSTADADNLVVTATGSASDFDAALQVTETNYHVPGPHGQAQTVYASPGSPRVPASLAGDVLAVLGLSNYRPFVSEAAPAVGKPAGAPSASTTIPAGERVPADFVSRYGLNPVEKAGATGQGQTVGIVTLASLNPSVPQYFWSVLLHERTLAGRITLENVDGGAGPVSLNAGSDETTLDVEQSGAIAPQSKIVVYQAPNTDYGFVDAFYRAASDNSASSVSASWGESETAIALAQAAGQESAAYGIAFDQAFMEMAAQGQSGFVSSADEGAYDATADAHTTNLSVDNPGDSPYVTSAGGTTLPGSQTYDVADSSGDVTGSESVTIPEELSWSSDYLWPMYQALGVDSEQAAATTFDSGSGGGYSAIEGRPSYQSSSISGIGTYGSVDYLTPAPPTDGGLPTAFDYDPSPTVTTGQAAPAGRQVPDLSTDADPQTGYALYDPQFESEYGTDILQFGGTSFVAPQLNGSAAVLDSALGHRVGFWNPVIYRAATATAGAASPLTPISDDTIYGASQFSATGSASIPANASLSNNNLYYTGQPGTIYNPATGLGTPNLTRLLGYFAAR